MSKSSGQTTPQSQSAVIVQCRQASWGRCVDALLTLQPPTLLLSLPFCQYWFMSVLHPVLCTVAHVTLGAHELLLLLLLVFFQLKILIKMLLWRRWLEGNFSKGKAPGSVAVSLYRALLTFCFIIIILHDHDTWYQFVFGDKTHLDSQMSIIRNTMVMTVADTCGWTALAGSTGVEMPCMTCKHCISLAN